MFGKHGHFANGLNRFDRGHRYGVVGHNAQGSREQDVHLVARGVVGADNIPLLVGAGTALAQDLGDRGGREPDEKRDLLDRLDQCSFLVRGHGDSASRECQSRERENM